MNENIFRRVEEKYLLNKFQKEELLKRIDKYLEKDKVIGIFPEGTFNRGEGVILPFKIGAVKMASETGAPIVPLVITGKYKLFSKDLTFEFLKPIKVPKKEDLTKENEKLMNIISKKIEEKRKQ